LVIEKRGKRMMDAATGKAQETRTPFEQSRLDGLMEEAGLDVLIATSKHNVQYLLGGYKFIVAARTTPPISATALSAANTRTTLSGRPPSIPHAGARWMRRRWPPSMSRRSAARTRASA
jgi:Xaa-Pro aminopeptidase